MACFKPYMAKYGPVNPETGKNSIIIGKAFDGDDPKAYDLLKTKSIFLIPCGKCLGCKLDYARHWADRMMLEFECTHKAVFVTLTYEDKCLPNVSSVTGELFSAEDLNADGTRIAPLDKKDMSDFMKRLRSKFVDNGHEEIKPRFFGCGEYGSEKHRPHLHIILFGVSLEDLCIRFRGDIQGSLEPWVRNELGQVSYRSNLLEDVWEEKGIVTVSETSYETFGYVARYSVKKAKGDSYAKDYGLPEEFTSMSRNPGIGLPFLLEHDIYSSDSWSVKDKKIFWPKILIQKDVVFDINGDPFYYNRDEDDEFLTFSKEKRSALALNTFLNKFETSSKSYADFQHDLERNTAERVSVLKRGDVN